MSKSNSPFLLSVLCFIYRPRPRLIPLTPSCTVCENANSLPSSMLHADTASHTRKICIRGKREGRRTSGPLILLAAVQRSSLLLLLWVIRLSLNRCCCVSVCICSCSRPADHLIASVTSDPEGACTPAGKSSREEVREQKCKTDRESSGAI